MAKSRDGNTVARDSTFRKVACGRRSGAFDVARGRSGGEVGWCADSIDLPAPNTIKVKTRVSLWKLAAGDLKAEPHPRGILPVITSELVRKMVTETAL